MHPTTAPPIGLDAAVAAAVRSALEAVTGGTAPAEDGDRLANGIPDAVRRTGLSRTTLYRLMDAGRLGYVKVGARRLIPEDDLRALMAGHRSAA